MRKISRLGSEARLGWALVAPALAVIALIAIFPLGWTLWESLHLHELRMPWLGQPFIGLANYIEIAKDPRFWAALGHTAFFTVVSIYAIALWAGLEALRSLLSFIVPYLGLAIIVLFVAGFLGLR